MDSRTYKPISREQLQSFLTQAGSNGFQVAQVTPDSGTVSGHSTVVSFAYDEPSETITLVLEKHVPLAGNATWSQIEHHLPTGVSKV